MVLDLTHDKSTVTKQIYMQLEIWKKFLQLSNQVNTIARRD